MVAAAVVGGVARARDRNLPWYSPPLLLLPDIILSFLCSFYKMMETGKDKEQVPLNSASRERQVKASALIGSLRLSLLIIQLFEHGSTMLLPLSTVAVCVPMCCCLLFVLEKEKGGGEQRRCAAAGGGGRAI